MAHGAYHGGVVNESFSAHRLSRSIIMAGETHGDLSGGGGVRWGKG